MSSTTSWARDPWPVRPGGARRASEDAASLRAVAAGTRQSWVAWGVLGVAVLADPTSHWTDGTTRKERTDV